jgi:hypothetical protein
MYKVYALDFLDTLKIEIQKRKVGKKKLKTCFA